eukprot:scaffold1880_cov166-Amphora_coffeaeformis.AAC.6
MSNAKRSFQVFVDLQCPFSKTFWANRKAIEERFAETFDFSVHVTSLLFHPQAFSAQKAAKVIELKLGQESKTKFIDACFARQESFMNKAAGDARPSEKLVADTESAWGPDEWAEKLKDLVA